MSNLISSMFDSATDSLSFTLRAGKYDESVLVVSSFTGREKLSALFVYQIDVVVDAETVASLDDATGQDAEFRILRDGEVERVVRGMVDSVAPYGTKGRQRAVRMTIVPKLGELRYVAKSRIYQDIPVNEIIEDLVKPHNIEMEWHVERRPLARPYRVQRNESDYAFFCRILADSGIHFHFLCNEKQTKLVLVDDARGYVPIDGTAKLPYSETGGAVTVDHIGRIERIRSLRPGSAATQEYDFKNPGTDLKARFEVNEPHNFEMAPRREVYEFPGDYVDFDTERSGTLRATRRLQSLRSDAVVFEGKSSCPRLCSGHKITIENHPDDDFNKELILDELRVRGRRAGILADTGGGPAAPGFTATFVAVTSDTVLRPTPWPRPLAPPESARVTGPKEGSPFVDKFGRVKVQFFWDREGKWDEKSSCWLRVMTHAAGGSRGIWFPPRVGDEVIVQFLNGDIDRPFVAGSFYNAVEVHPYPLPDDSSKSTIKTLTIPGGKGFNELTFEDKAGKEEIFLHAQKDRRTQVLHDHSETVGANQTVSVGANQSISVGANQTINVGANRTDTVGANETIHVVGNRTENVDKKETVTVKADRTHTVSEGNESLTVAKGGRDVKVPNGLDALTAKSKKDEIETTFDIKVGTSMTIHRNQDATLHLEAGKASLKTTTEIETSNPSGSIVLKDKKVTIMATDQLVLVCGNASVVLSKDGKITISGATEVGIGCQSSTVKLEPAQATLNGAAVTATASGMMQISGALIKIN